ncbi:organic hydroperoxide resistance protein [Saccharopolyspora hirsuta]|uniref:Organic hydroperoxide resistance protein n=1 Tax=Saccharopolyspora hirsuta TaxID=1837 RepID=A0A5M7BRE4_SACHI|nr:organic hydroperoxide resistance protein [Saccharopolyspora hirsuta]KAA5832816.1 organic hydroperoxide resistance protein [Saccharopolyspora hirsuta]
MTVLYTAEATATGAGRDGHTRSSDGVLDLDLAVPKELGGPGGAATNPEQLFAAGYAACFHSALQLVARRAKVDITGSQVTAQVGIGPNGNGGYGLSVGLVVDLPGVPGERAQELAAAADEVCPYSNAVRGNVEIDLRVA